MVSTFRINMTRTETESLLQSSGSGSRTNVTFDLEGQQQQIQDEYEEIKTVAGEIEDLHCLFSQLATLAEDQQPLISTIEESCTSVVDNLSNTNEQLESSIKIQVRSNKCKCWSIVILIFIIMLLAIYISITIPHIP